VRQTSVSSGWRARCSTLAALDAGLATYDRAAVHHRHLSRRTVERWLRPARRRDARSAPHPPGDGAGREDVLAAGLHILDAVMARFGVEELLSSENDILDGIAASFAEGDRA